MAVTIQQIADRAGVSRGTVYRALNNRGRIKPEVAEKIRRLAEEMGYEHKERSKPRKKQQTLKFGVVTQLAGASFMIEINRGIAAAAEELKPLAIEIIVKEVYGISERDQLDAIDQLLEEGIDGLAIMPLDSEEIREKLNRMTDDMGIPVVTFNSDVPGIKKKCFVGMDNRQSGKAAAGLMNVLTGGSGRVLIITDHFSSVINNARVDGFVDEIKSEYPNIAITGVQGSFNDADEVERIIVSTMMSISGINGILVVSGGQAGIGRAFDSLGLDVRPKVIIYDKTAKNERFLRDGDADFLIDQNGFVQGNRPLHILADILRKGQIPDEIEYTDIKIVTRYNL